MLEVIRTIFLLLTTPFILVFYLFLLIIFAIVLKLGRPKRARVKRNRGGMTSLRAKIGQQVSKVNRKRAAKAGMESPDEVDNDG